jgi:hypothetical protein
VNPPQNKWLLVEGYDDLRSIAGLMRHHVNWPQEKHLAPVWIEIGSGAESILQKDYISTLLKTPNIKTLGIMLDANGDPISRFSSFRNLCVGSFPNIPKQLPTEGLITDNNDGQRIGLWVMPDNSSKGAIEIFLKYLIPDSTAPVWAHAVKSVTEAKKLGASCKECHIEKANIFTWLAWQDEPGQSPGTALARKVLDPTASNAKPFVKWFMELYQLQPSINLQV